MERQETDRINELSNILTQGEYRTVQGNLVGYEEEPGGHTSRDGFVKRPIYKEEEIFQHSFSEHEMKRARKELLNLYDSSDEELRKYICDKASFDKIDIWFHHHPIQSGLIGLTINLIKITIPLAIYGGIGYGIYKAYEHFSN